MSGLKVKRVKYPIHPVAEDATAFIVALPTRLTKQKKRQWSDHCLIFLLRQSSRQDHSESCPTDYFRIIKSSVTVGKIADSIQVETISKNDKDGDAPTTPLLKGKLIINKCLVEHAQDLAQYIKELDK